MIIPKINESKLLESKLQSDYPCLLIKKNMIFYFYTFEGIVPNFLLQKPTQAPWV